MPLTNIKIDSAKSINKPQKLADGNGLYIFIPKQTSAAAPNHSASEKKTTKSWRYDFRFGGKRYTLTFGLYPSIGIAEARDLLRVAKKQIVMGVNPALEKRAQKQVRETQLVDTFEAIAKSWYESKLQIRSKAWREANALYLRRDLNPKIGSIPISQIDRRLLLGVLEKTKISRGIKTADRVRQTAIQVFDHAIRKMKTETNPARLLKNWEEIPGKVSHKPLRDDEINVFLDRVDAYPGFMTTKICIKLLLLTFVRKNEMVGAKWNEFDLDSGKWIIPSERMKMKEAHVVPLSHQSLAALAQLKPLSFGSEYLFPSISTIEKSMSGSTLNRAFQKMGYADKFNPHGVRATASTWLNSQGFRADVIERQLAHSERNQIRAAYNHADYLQERIAMMQAWADFVVPRSISQ